MIEIGWIKDRVKRGEYYLSKHGNIEYFKETILNAVCPSSNRSRRLFQSEKKRIIIICEETWR